jgi:hypothetical protein
MKKLTQIFVLISALCWNLAFGQWAAPQTLSQVSFEVTTPQIAWDCCGNAIAVWDEQDAMGNHVVQAAVFNLNTNEWSAAKSISSSSIEPMTPQIALGSCKSAFAVWDQYDSIAATHVVQSAIYHFNTGSWSSPATLSQSSSESTNPQIAADTSGNAIAVWELNSFAYFVQAAVYDVQTKSWLSFLANLSEGSQINTNPQIAISDCGTAIAAWNQNLSITTPSIFGYVPQVAHYNFSTHSWSAPMNLFNVTSQNDVSSQTTNVQVGMDRCGNGVTLWQRSFQTGGVSIESSIYNRERNLWRGPVLLDNVFTNPSVVSLSVAKKGNAVGVWTDSGSNTAIRSAQYDFAARSWLSAKTIAEGSIAFDIALESPQVGTDCFGNAVAVWVLNNNNSPSNSLINAAKLNFKTGIWTAPENISVEGSLLFATTPEVAVDCCGNAISVWDLSSNQSHFIQAATSLALPQPPSHVRAKFKKNRFLTQTEREIAISWKCPSECDPCDCSAVLGYRIYKGSSLIKEVRGAQTCCVCICDPCSKECVTYQVVAFNSIGESAPVSVILRDK